MSSTPPQVWVPVACERSLFLISSPEHPPGGKTSVSFLTLKQADFMFYFKNNPQAQVITVEVYLFHFGQPSLSRIA